MFSSKSHKVNNSIKLHKLRETKSFIQAAKKAGQEVVIVTGCFDLLTIAHFAFLKKAKAVGNILVVGIEDDNRVRAFKGPTRPVNSIRQRVVMMDTLEFVDFVFVISGSTKIELRSFYRKLHQTLGANILAITKGDPNTQARKEQIEVAGGKLAEIINPSNTSTTSVLRNFLNDSTFAEPLFPKQFPERVRTQDEKRKDLINWEQSELPLDSENRNKKD